VRPDDYARLVSAVRQTAGALRAEADYVESQDRALAETLRLRAVAFDSRAAEMERQVA
jgi:hypothetical protein